MCCGQINKSARRGRQPGCPWKHRPVRPPDADCIDFLFFVRDRHQGNREAMRGYLSWAEALPAQIEADGDAHFSVRTP